MDSLFGYQWSDMKSVAEAMWEGGSVYIIMAVAAMLLTAFFTLRSGPR